MKPLILGCEYAGTTAPAIAKSRWTDEVVGGTVFGGLAFQDHFKLPEGGHVGSTMRPTSPRRYSKKLWASIRGTDRATTTTC